GDKVIPGTRAIGTVAAAGDVVEITAGHLVEHGQCLAGAVQRTLGGQRAALIGNGDQGGPLRGSRTGAVNLDPSGFGRGIVNRIRRVRRGVVGDVGNRAHAAALGDHALL